MLKTLLLNPPSIKSHAYFKDVHAGGRSVVNLVAPPLNLAYIAAYLREKKVKIGLLDANALKYDIKQLKNYLLKTLPDIVVLQIVVCNLVNDIKISKLIKHVLPSVKIIIFGTVATVYSSYLLKKDVVDYVIVGEPEITVFELINALNKNEKLDSIKGLAWKKKNKIIYNKKRKLLKDLDTLPFPARDLLPVDKYYQPIAKENPYMTMRSSRGCIYDCLFCGTKTTGQNAWRGRDPLKVVDEMEEIFLKYGTKEIEMYDEQFLIDRERVIKICKGIIRRGFKPSWIAMGRVDLVDEELLTYLRKAGCYRIDYGVEHANEEILKTIRKGVTQEQIREAFRMSKKVGIGTGALMIIGMPGETWQTVKEMMQFLKEIRPDFVKFSIATPYLGTDFYEIAKKNNWLIEKDFEHYNLAEHVISYPNFSNEDIRHAQKWCYKNYYLSFPFILSRISKNISLKDLKSLLTRFFAFLKFMRTL